MRIIVLSRSSKIQSTRRLVEAGRARGHQMKVLNPSKVEVHLDNKKSRLLYNQKQIKVPDVVIPRIAASIANYGLPVVEQFGNQGAMLMNTARAIGQSRNPVRCLQKLAAHGLSIPSTVMARDAKGLKSMIHLVGGVPVLVKLLQGSEGRGVMVCESEQSLEAALEALLGLGHNIVMQEYVRRAGRDIRVFVVGGKALAAVARVPKAGRMSRTLSRFGQLQLCELDENLKSVAEKAARVCKLEVCAIDMLEIKNKSPSIFEINASPSLTDMELATGIDLATPIIIRAEELKKMHLSTSGDSI